MAPDAPRHVGRQGGLMTAPMVDPVVSHEIELIVPFTPLVAASGDPGK